MVASGSARSEDGARGGGSVRAVVCIAVVIRTQRSILMAWVGVAFSSIDINQGPKKKDQIKAALKQRGPSRGSCLDMRA